MRVALVGTRGVPARYGGFETCVEEVGQRLVARGHEVIVYCRDSGLTGTDARLADRSSYLGMKLVHLPAWHAKAAETLSHSALSVGHLIRRPTDVAIVFNAANACLLPALRSRGIPVATHVDGLEWQRTKWRGTGRRFYRVSESLAVRWSDALIADAGGIADYYRREFGAPTVRIAYGAPILPPDLPDDRLALWGLTPGGYHLLVARYEPENHVDLLVEGYVRSGARRHLVVVGSAPYADAYTARVRSLADDRVHLVGGIWDQDALDQLYAHAATYLHGHSVGGTNPSLLRAIGAGTATIAYDVSFNREVLGDDGVYIHDADGVAAAVEAAESDPAATATRGERLRQRARAYDWGDVAERYEALCRDLVPRRRADRPSGRRLRPS